jgi:hypothetical protein
MANKFCDLLSKTLRQMRNEEKILYYYRVPNLKMANPVFGDFLIILKDGFSLYLEAKSTHSNSFDNVFGNNDVENHKVQCGQNEFNEKMKKTGEKYSCHRYIFGKLEKSCRNGDKTQIEEGYRYFIVYDINQFRLKVEAKQPKMIDLNRYANMKSNDLYKLIDSLLASLDHSPID